MWERFFQPTYFIINSKSFIIKRTGGSVKIADKITKNTVKEFKGYTYLYTGDVHPEETEFFALENGKHFFVYSLKSFELIKRITLPKGYYSSDVCGFYSNDGEVINIPAERYVYEDKAKNFGHYEYVLCKYSTDNYSLIGKEPIPGKGPYHWDMFG
jgi:hypothetical protein